MSAEVRFINEPVHVYVGRGSGLYVAALGMRRATEDGETAILAADVTATECREIAALLLVQADRIADEVSRR